MSPFELHKSKKESIKSYKLEQLRAEEEAERRKRIEELDREIRSLELSVEPYRDISLTDVEVSHIKYGTGVIVGQNVNQITVRFGDLEKVFVIHKKYRMRPVFENDNEVVEAFTAYSDTLDRIERLRSVRDRLLQ